MRTTEQTSGNIAISVIRQANGHCLCEATASVDGCSIPTLQSHGQNPKHAIAGALENLARTFRREAEAEQNIPWNMDDDRFPAGGIEQRYHVIVHYESVGEDKTKFRAFENTLMGNTVVEEAEVSVILVDPDLPIEPLRKEPIVIKKRGSRRKKQTPPATS